MWNVPAQLSSGARSPTLCLKIPLVPYACIVLSEQRRLAGSPEPLLFSYVVSTLVTA